MTGKKNGSSLTSQILLGVPSGLAVEIRKTKLGAVAVVLGVLSVLDISDTSALLATHFGRIHFVGEGISLSVFSGRTVELIGKILSVEFSYGKS